MGFHNKSTTFVGHVHIKVENLEKSLQYYQEIIGLTILEQTSTKAKLTTDGRTNILTLEQPENVTPKQEKTTGLYHFALLLPKKSDLANIVEHLKEKGVRFGSSDHLVSEALYLYDPDGNQIEIYIDREPSTWTWNGEEVAMTIEPLDFKDLQKSIEPGKVWEGMPKDTILGHIHLYVSELIKTEEFYVKGLGFDVVNRYGEQALFLSTGKYHHHIGVNTWNGVGAPQQASNSAGMESFTLIFPNEEAINETVTNLKKIGASVSDEDGRRITYDPSGNCIELAV